MIKEVSLSDVCIFENGDRGKNYPSQSSFVPEGIPFINAGDLKNQLICSAGTSFITEEHFNKLSGGKIQVNDILFCLRGSLGKFAINKVITKGAIASSLVILRAKNNLSHDYLKHYLNSPMVRGMIEKANNGSSQPNLSASSVKNFSIPLPPLQVQQKIAAILDVADELRKKDKALVAKYDELTQALFIDMFGDPVTNPKGWEIIKLGLITHMKAGKFVSASEIYSNNEKGLYSCYGGNGIRGFVKTYTHEGDYVLIGRQGALCGNVKVVNGKFHATEHAIVCSTKMVYKPLWLYYLLDILNLNRYATGAAQPGLNVGTLEELGVIFAPYELQNQFAERVEAIEVQKKIAQASALKSDELFNSLLQKAFNGEVS